MSIASDVDRGLKIYGDIERLAKELEEIEARLTAAALKGNQVELNDADREGKQYLAEGSEHIVPVVITADALAKTFADDSPTHSRIKAAADGKLTEFYRSKTTWETLIKDGKQFRMQAKAILGEAAPAFITACVSRDKDGIPKNSIKVEWDRADLAPAPQPEAGA